MTFSLDSKHVIFHVIKSYSIPDLYFMYVVETFIILIEKIYINT